MCTFADDRFLSSAYYFNDIFVNLDCMIDYSPVRFFMTEDDRSME
jgi:hypothetical protein